MNILKLSRLYVNVVLSLAWRGFTSIYLRKPYIFHRWVDRRLFSTADIFLSRKTFYFKIRLETFGSLCTHRGSLHLDGEAGVRKKCGTCLLLTSPELSPGCSLVPQLQSVISPSPNLVPFSVSLLGYSYHRFLLPRATLSTIGTRKDINRGFVAARNDTRHQIRAIKCSVQRVDSITSRTCKHFGPVVLMH